MAALASFLLTTTATAGTVWIPGCSEGVSNVAVRSIQERKFDRVVRQQYDFSCGSAALATLLTYHYEDPTGEAKAFRAMFEKGDQEKITKVGFSLLDMKNYLEAIGYQADGYQAELSTLTDAKVPAIALINYRGYRHFVVVKGVSEQEVVLGDPSLGLRSVPRSEFQKMWENGILFIIRNKAAVGQRNFNANADWGRILRAPLELAVDRESLANLTVLNGVL
ncbi:MAG: C39 family peptidase [Gammaproteobacteria bacterium]|nr:C39 family peptidase [Gammaproteobacteria bacterium]